MSRKPDVPMWYHHNAQVSLNYPDWGFASHDSGIGQGWWTTYQDKTIFFNGMNSNMTNQLSEYDPPMVLFYDHVIHLWDNFEIERLEEYPLYFVLTHLEELLMGTLL